MKLALDAAVVLKEARAWAGVTQRELARRAHTSQSVVARIESGHTRPSLDTLRRLLEALRLEARLEICPAPIADTHMLEDVARILSLTPEQRLLEVRNLAAFEAAARRG